MTEFYETRAGMRFYESTVPALVRELQRLNENLERLIDKQPQPKTEIEHDPQGRTEDPQPPQR